MQTCADQGTLHWLEDYSPFGKKGTHVHTGRFRSAIGRKRMMAAVYYLYLKSAGDSALIP